MATAVSGFLVGQGCKAVKAGTHRKVPTDMSMNFIDFAFRKAPIFEQRQHANCEAMKRIVSHAMKAAQASTDRRAFTV